MYKYISERHDSIYEVDVMSIWEETGHAAVIAVFRLKTDNSSKLFFKFVSYSSAYKQSKRGINHLNELNSYVVALL